jgi:hypothetical protein
MNWKHTTGLKYDEYGSMIRTLDDQGHVADMLEEPEDGAIVAIRGYGQGLPQDENGRRFVACINACDAAGLTNEFLDSGR